MMQTRLKLKPGQKGTKQLLAKYGEQLVCVRYRYDKERKKRIKTVELIVDEIDWCPPSVLMKGETVVAVRIGLQERELQRQMKAAGGKWNRDKRVWELRYDRVREMGLEERIVRQGECNIRRF